VSKKKVKRPYTAPSPSLANYDGIQNIVSGLGRAGRDANVFNRFVHNPFMSRDEVEAQYKDNGIARRIIDMLPDEALKKGIDCDQALYAELERLDAFQVFARASKDARLYGGALVVILAKDGVADLSLPLNVSGLQSIDSLAVFDRYACNITLQDFENDPYSPNYGQVRTYRLTLPDGQLLSVHASRVIRFDGDRLPSHLFRANAYWHASTLQGCNDSLKSYLAAQGFSDTIIKNWSLIVLKIQGLVTSYAAGCEAEIAKRINDASTYASMLNMLMLDADGEEFERHFSKVDGYADLMLRAMELVASSCGIPMTRLFGRAPEGMNATGDGDARLWHAQVEAYQMQVFQAPFNRLINLLMQQKAMTPKPDSAEWNFVPIATLSQLELSEVRLKQAQADNIYMQAGAIDADYLWHIRHEGGYNANPPYSLESLAKYEAEADKYSTEDPNGLDDSSDNEDG